MEQNTKTVQEQLASLNTEIEAYSRTIEDASQALASAERDLNELVQELAEENN